MPAEPSTLNSVARVVAETLEACYGVAAEPIFAAAGLDPATLHVARARYPYRNMQRLWAEATQAARDPSFALRAGERVRPVTFGVLGVAWSASATLREALHRLCRYGHVISTAPRNLGLVDDGAVCRLELVTPASTGLLFQMTVDALFSSVVTLMRMVATQDAAPLEVRLRHADFGKAAEYERVFACPVRFDAAADELVLAPALLDALLVGRESEIARASDLDAERYLRAIEAPEVIAEVRRLLVALLPSGETDLAELAGRMNRSASTLQRQLQAEQVTYREILEQTRRFLAEGYLGDPRVSLSEIAFLLGFSDQSGFSRAFRRWTGISPARFRASAAGASPDVSSPAAEH